MAMENEADLHGSDLDPLEWEHGGVKCRLQPHLGERRGRSYELGQWYVYASFDEGISWVHAGYKGYEPQQGFNCLSEFRQSLMDEIDTDSLVAAMRHHFGEDMQCNIQKALKPEEQSDDS